tara:strand:- start:176 stop:430 length:255 start_codon:yes stop_codon:yes gene_type:complete
LGALTRFPLQVLAASLNSPGGAGASFSRILLAGSLRLSLWAFHSNRGAMGFNSKVHLSLTQAINRKAMKQAPIHISIQNPENQT